MHHHQYAESGSHSAETPKEIRCKTIDEVTETSEKDQSVVKEATTTVSVPPVAKTKPKAPPPPVISSDNRPAGDTKQPDDAQSAVSDVTSCNETQVPANDASKSDISVVEVSSKSLEAKANETPSKRKAPSKPLLPEATSEITHPIGTHYESEAVISFAKDELHHPDTSHVSIVTIDDNGKDVTITTTSHADDLANEDDEGHADDSFNSFSNSSSSRSSDRVKAILGEVSHSEDVIVLKDRASAKEVIHVSNEHVSKVTPSTSDDQISIKTQSSDSSDGHYIFADANRSVHVEYDKNARSVTIDVAQNSRKPAVVSPVTDRKKPDDQVTNVVSRTISKPDPVIQTSNARTVISSSSSSANGLMSSSSSSLPPVSQNNNLRREASDAGSCGSFVSVNSDKENVTSADARLSPGVVLRRKKVSTRLAALLIDLTRVSDHTRLSHCMYSAEDEAIDRILFSPPPLLILISILFS
jgi:hypothetical protein